MTQSPVPDSLETLRVLADAGLIELAEVTCVDCGRQVWGDEYVLARGATHCDTCWFWRFGDMLTPDELAALELHGQDAAEARAMLADYHRAGIAHDQDPSYFEVSMPVDESTTWEAVVGTAVDAFRLRMGAPEELAE